MISCRFGEGISTLAISSTPVEPHVSPALTASASSKKTTAPAYELKFLLSGPQARELEQRASERLALDPYADPTLGHAYSVTSVYFDTPSLDVCRRSQGFRRHKHRIRRYGAETIAHLERKSKKNGQVSKRRISLPWDELALLDDRPSASADDWAGEWFARQLAKSELRPVCRVTYRRTAFVGSDAHGPIRITMDRAIVGALTRSPHPEPLPADQGSPLLSGEVIVEFKYLVAAPTLFKGWIEEMRLAPSSISKYRRCAQECGLTSLEESEGHRIHA